MPKTDVATAQASVATKPASPRVRLSFPKARMVPGYLEHVYYVDGYIEGQYLWPDNEASRKRGCRVHIASLAILEDLPPKAE